MSNSYSSTLSPYAQELEDSRSFISIEIETLSHHITLWYAAHPECRAEIAAYKARLAFLDYQAGEDDLAAQHLLLTAAKDEYRILFGIKWELRS